MSKRVTVELEDTIYEQLQDIVAEEDADVTAAIQEAVRRYLQGITAREDDPFFHIGQGRSGLGDLAADHDRYLYGTRADPSGS